jgi:hypothetical protein
MTFSRFAVAGGVGGGGAMSANLGNVSMLLLFGKKAEIRSGDCPQITSDTRGTCHRSWSD